MTGELALQFFALALIAVASGFVHSAIGFGFAIVALTFLPFVMDTRDAHVMLTLASVPMLSQVAWSYRSGTHWPSLRPALLGGAVMLPLGAYLFHVMPLDLLVRATGIAILAMVFVSLRNKRLVANKESTGTSLIAGGIAGFLGGAVSIGGPPVATYALQQGWPAERFKAFLAQFLLALTVYRVFVLLIGHDVTTNALWKAAWITPFCMIGIQWGVVTSKKISADRFQQIVAVVLIGVACMLMYKGAPDKKTAPQPAEVSPQSTQEPDHD